MLKCTVMNGAVKRKICGVIFDMDGTLFDTERLGMRMWDEAIRRLNAPFNEEFKYRIIGVNRATSAAIANEMFGENSLFDEVAALSNKLFREYLDKNGVPVKEGARDLLEYVSSSGLKAALATSTSRQSAEKTLKSAGIYGYFNAFAFGNEVENGKPAPDIFLLAAKRLDVDISVSAVVEDSLNGIKAAKRSGAFVIAVPDILPLKDYSEYYDEEFSSLGGVEAFLRKING